MAQRKTPPLTAELSATRRPVDKISPQRVSGHYSAEGPRSAQIQKASTLERKERRVIRSDQSNYTHRHRAQPAR